MYAITRSSNAAWQETRRVKATHSIVQTLHTKQKLSSLCKNVTPYKPSITLIGVSRSINKNRFSGFFYSTRPSYKDSFINPHELRLLRSNEQPNKVVTEAAKEFLKKETLHQRANLPKESGVVSETPIKKSLMTKIKDELVHYWHGTKLLSLEVKISTKLLLKMVTGFSLSRREQRQLQRTTKDLTRLVPFLIFVIVPFMELLLPVALKLFPNMLPSTYESKSQAEEKRKKLMRVRIEMAKYLRETVAEKVASSDDSEAVKAAKEFGELFKKVRKTGVPASTQEVMNVAKQLEDELTLDNLSRPQIISMCRFLGINSFGTDNFLRYQIRNKMRYLKADDRMIYAEGIETLTSEELQTACLARGIRTLGLSPERMRFELAQWLDLHLRHKVPSSILILSRAFSISDQVPGWTPDALQATLSSLPENLVNETELNVSEASGSSNPKQKLDVITEQEAMIANELEEVKQEAEKRKKSEGKKHVEPLKDATKKEA